MFTTPIRPAWHLLNLTFPMTCTSCSKQRMQWAKWNKKQCQGSPRKTLHYMYVIARDSSYPSVGCLFVSYGGSLKLVESKTEHLRCIFYSRWFISELLNVHTRPRGRLCSGEVTGAGREIVAEGEEAGRKGEWRTRALFLPQIPLYPIWSATQSLDNAEHA